ncbi:MAG: hypothetical protein M3O82_02085, partial [Verrucomicrobiota bacterium]|nr:hypothetical protein [Verrucomicrobiota bacterium]
NAFNTQTPVEISVGDFRFNAVLGDDPTYVPGFNEARFAVSGQGDGSLGGSVVLYWTPTRLNIAVEGVDIDCLGIENLPWTTGSFSGTGALFADIGLGNGSGSTALTSAGRGKIVNKTAGGTRFTLHSLTITATVDKQRPAIEITAAAVDTTAATPTVSLSGEVFDESFTAQITRVTVNGQEFDGEVVLADPDEAGVSSFQIDAIELAPGVNVIEIESTDFNGNATTVRRRISAPRR